MEFKSLHMFVLKRLILAFVIISSFVCLFDYNYGLNQINKSVAKLANNESRGFISNCSLFIANNDSDGLENVAKTFLKNSNFLVVEVYNIDEKQIADAVKPEIKDIEERFNKIDHGHLFKGPVKFQQLSYKDKIYIRTASTITTNGADIGYFEGLYAVPDDDLAEIKRQVFASLLKVISIVFVTTLALYPVIISLNRKVAAHSKILLDANISTLESLGNSIAKRDSDTNDHNYRVTLYSIALAEKLSLGDAFLRDMIKGAFLHDVGKIAISDSILLKPGRLTDEEFKTMQTHVMHGVEIIKDCAWLKEAGSVVEYHHEKFDGTGYPKGVKGADIPLPARIFCIVDVFDALTSKRPYKDPFPYEKSVGILRNGSGSHFDPEILESFLEISEDVHGAFRSQGENELKDALRKKIHDIFS